MRLDKYIDIELDGEASEVISHKHGSANMRMAQTVLDLNPDLPEKWKKRFEKIAKHSKYADYFPSMLSHLHKEGIKVKLSENPAKGKKIERKDWD